jgi:hypothetical protein
MDPSQRFQFQLPALVFKIRPRADVETSTDPTENQPTYDIGQNVHFLLRPQLFDSDVAEGHRTIVIFEADTA